MRNLTRYSPSNHYHLGKRRKNFNGSVFKDLPTLPPSPFFPVHGARVADLFTVQKPSRVNAPVGGKSITEKKKKERKEGKKGGGQKERRGEAK